MALIEMDFANGGGGSSESGRLLCAYYAGGNAMRGTTYYEADDLSDYFDFSGDNPLTITLKKNLSFTLIAINNLGASMTGTATITQRFLVGDNPPALNGQGVWDIEGSTGDTVVITPRANARQWCITV